MVVKGHHSKPKQRILYISHIYKVLKEAKLTYQNLKQGMLSDIKGIQGGFWCSDNDLNFIMNVVIFT